MNAYWCCVSCGWNAGTTPIQSGNECDNCGDDEFMCSECARADGCSHLPAAITNSHTEDVDRSSTGRDAMSDRAHAKPPAGGTTRTGGLSPGKDCHSDDKSTRRPIAPSPTDTITHVHNPDARSRRTLLMEEDMSEYRALADHWIDQSFNRDNVEAGRECVQLAQVYATLAVADAIASALEAFALDLREGFALTWQVKP